MEARSGVEEGICRIVISMFLLLHLVRPIWVAVDPSLILGDCHLWLVGFSDLMSRLLKR